MKNLRNLGAYCGQVIFFLFISYAAIAADLNQEKTQLKVDVDALGRDIAAVEKDILLPSASRVEVFLSLAPNVEYTLKSVTLLLDGNEVASHTYSGADIKSLLFGALHTVWQGNVDSGSHVLQAKFSGIDRKDKPVQNTATLDFEKSANHRSLELKITFTEEDKIVVYSVKDWGDK